MVQFYFVQSVVMLQLFFCICPNKIQHFKYPIGRSCHNIELYAMASKGKLSVLGDSSVCKQLKYE